MEFNSVQEWVGTMSIRVARQGQWNYFVEQDVASSMNVPSLLPGQYRLGINDFERLSIGGKPTVCITVGGMQKLYASASGLIDIAGGMPLPSLNSPSIANTKTDHAPLPVPERDYDSPIQKALTPFLSCVIGPNNAILVTPELAGTLLGGNLKNRPKNNRNFKKLCLQLRQGKWQVNGATITLSRNWKLLDGQHRLFAIVETGIPALCIIGFGFDPSAFATLDQGAKRTNADNLSIAGFANARLLAPTIGVYQAVKNAQPVNTTNRAIEPEECVRFAQKMPHLKDAVKKANEYFHKGARFVSPSLVGGLMARAMEIDKRGSARFFEYLLNDNCNGVRPTSIQKLRTRLMRDYMDKTRGANASHIAALMIKTWNAFRKGKSVGVLKFVAQETVDGVTTGEPYPIMS